MVAGGLPVHIAARLLGHHSLAVTERYVAVYDQDVVDHHRAFIARRRAERPGEEYREPSAAEWVEFEQHFTKRKVELGTCARPYGTPCRHEHACITMTAEQPDKTKNMLLRLDPTLAEQLQAVAQVEGRSISDVAREAIAALVEQRRSDQRFLKLLDDNLARHQRLLRLLRDDQP
jgi:hypothetical protein